MFAILIALIFVHESIDKLLQIKKSYRYTNNPFLYKDDFNENTSQCFRCVYKDSILNGTFVTPDPSIFTERKVCIKLKLVMLGNLS